MVLLVRRDAFIKNRHFFSGGKIPSEKWTKSHQNLQNGTNKMERSYSMDKTATKERFQVWASPISAGENQSKSGVGLRGRGVGVVAHGVINVYIVSWPPFCSRWDMSDGILLRWIHRFVVYIPHYSSCRLTEVLRKCYGRSLYDHWIFAGEHWSLSAMWSRTDLFVALHCVVIMY